MWVLSLLFLVTVARAQYPGTSYVTLWITDELSATGWEAAIFFECAEEGGIPFGNFLGLDALTTLDLIDPDRGYSFFNTNGGWLGYLAPFTISPDLNNLWADVLTLQGDIVREGWVATGWDSTGAPSDNCLDWVSTSGGDFFKASNLSAHDALFDSGDLPCDFPRRGYCYHITGVETSVVVSSPSGDYDANVDSLSYLINTTQLACENELGESTSKMAFNTFEWTVLQSERLFSLDYTVMAFPTSTALMTGFMSNTQILTSDGKLPTNGPITGYPSDCSGIQLSIGNSDKSISQTLLTTPPVSSSIITGNRIIYPDWFNDLSANACPGASVTRDDVTAYCAGYTRNQPRLIYTDIALDGNSWATQYEDACRAVSWNGSALPLWDSQVPDGITFYNTAAMPVLYSRIETTDDLKFRSPPLNHHLAFRNQTKEEEGLLIDGVFLDPRPCYTNATDFANTLLPSADFWIRNDLKPCTEPKRAICVDLGSNLDIPPPSEWYMALSLTRVQGDKLRPAIADSVCQADYGSGAYAVLGSAERSMYGVLRPQDRLWNIDGSILIKNETSRLFMDGVFDSPPSPGRSDLYDSFVYWSLTDGNGLPGDERCDEGLSTQGLGLVGRAASLSAGTRNCSDYLNLLCALPQSRPRPSTPSTFPTSEVVFIYISEELDVLDLKNETKTQEACGGGLVNMGNPIPAVPLVLPSSTLTGYLHPRLVMLSLDVPEIYNMRGEDLGTPQQFALGQEQGHIYLKNASAVFNVDPIGTDLFESVWLGADLASCNAWTYANDSAKGLIGLVDYWGESQSTAFGEGAIVCDAPVNRILCLVQAPITTTLPPSPGPGPVRPAPGSNGGMLLWVSDAISPSWTGPSAFDSICQANAAMLNLTQTIGNAAALITRSGYSIDFQIRLTLAQKFYRPDGTFLGSLDTVLTFALLKPLLDVNGVFITNDPLGTRVWTGDAQEDDTCVDWTERTGSLYARTGLIGTNVGVLANWKNARARSCGDTTVDRVICYQVVETL